MQYLATIYEDETRWATMGPDEGAKEMEAYRAFGEAAAERIAGGNALQPTSTATTIRVRNGERLVTDGPFAETKEQLGGYYLLECKDLDEAIEWASKIPGAQSGSVEVRPVMVFDEQATVPQAQTATA